MKFLTFDIETSPRPLAELQGIMPEFEPGANLKDPEKIKAAIEVKRQNWLDDAALSAMTGRVLAIGVLQDEKFAVIAGDEKTMLLNFWDLITVHWTSVDFVGFNIMGFDLPFLVRRSMVHGVKVPSQILNLTKYRHDFIVDLMEKWRLWTDERISLNNLAKLLGVGEKTGSGADFAKLWETDMGQAIDYLKNDVELTAKIHQKLL